jgi:hypothetical protein
MIRVIGGEDKFSEEYNLGNPFDINIFKKYLEN